MNIDKLVTTGLTKGQAEAYSLVIKHGQINPSIAVKELGLSRTNAYKVLDKLVELGLIIKSSDKGTIYSYNNPIALTNMVTQLRSEAVNREEAINSLMGDLLANYYRHSEQPIINVVSGNKAIAEAFRNQINLNEDIYFIRSRADIPTMGFDTMHEIRTRPGVLGNKRFGILQELKNSTVDEKAHKLSNLEVTRIKEEDYTAPVEWTVTKTSLLIVLYAQEPHAITITNPIIAQAFLQIWHLINTSVNKLKENNIS